MARPDRPASRRCRDRGQKPRIYRRADLGTGVRAGACLRLGPSRPGTARPTRLEGAMTNLSSLLEQAAASHPDRIALRLDDLTLTYAELHEAAGRMSALLSSLGVAAGDRVGVMLPNVPAFPIACYGALAAGAVVVPMNPLLKSREVAYYLGDSGAKVLFAWHAAADEASKGAADAGAQVIRVDEPDLRTPLAGF